MASLAVLAQPILQYLKKYCGPGICSRQVCCCSPYVTADPEEQKKSETKISVERVPNMAVDIQRNRILATAVLKQAEALADQGQ